MGFFTDLIGGAINSYIENKDADDTLKTLVFLAGYNTKIERQEKKLIVQAISILDEDATLFEYEDKIDSIQRDFQIQSLEVFFDDILSTRINRDKIENFFTLDVLLFLKLYAEELVKAEQMYNLYTLKNKFNLTKTELRNCYQTVANIINLDFNTVAEKIELMTQEETIRELLRRNPALITGHDEDNEDDEQDNNDDEFSYCGNLEDGEKLLSKWNEIFTSDLESFFDKSLTMTKTEDNVFDFSDNEKELLFTTSDDFEDDEDGYIIIKFIKNNKTLIYSYTPDDNDNKTLSINLTKQDEIILNFEIGSLSKYEFFDDFLSYMDELNMEIPEDFVENQKNFISKLNEKFLESNSKSRFSDLDDF